MIGLNAISEPTRSKTEGASVEVEFEVVELPPPPVHPPKRMQIVIRK